MRIRRKEQTVYGRELYYEQWTGCPSCGYRPAGEIDPEPDLLRVGITNDIGRRTRGGYQRDLDADYFDHVAVITVRHHQPGTTRDEAKSFETGRIRHLRPPFNKRDNDRYREQAIERRRILDQPVAWIDVRDTAVERVRRWGRTAAIWFASVSFGVAGLVGLVAALS